MQMSYRTSRWVETNLSVQDCKEVRFTMKVMSKSNAAKKARKGIDLGKKGKNFSKIAQKAAKRYGSTAAGKRVAGAIFQKMRRKGAL